MRTMADVKGKKIGLRAISAQRVIDIVSRAVLATVGLTERDVTPVLVPNVGPRRRRLRGRRRRHVLLRVRRARRLREVDATVGGIRALECRMSGMPAARKIYADGYLAPAGARPILHRRRQADGRLHLGQSACSRNAKVKDEIVYKLIEALAKNKADLVAVAAGAPRVRAGRGCIRNSALPYHPGALNYFADNKIEIKAAR